MSSSRPPSDARNDTTSSFDITSLSSKGQVVIPSSIRDALRLPVGAKLAVFTDGENVLLHPIKKPDLSVFTALRVRCRETAKKTPRSQKKRGDT